MILPTKQGDLLRLAISDARKCAEDPRFTFDMSTWLETDGTKCMVCLAGAVMAKSFGVTKTVVNIGTLPYYQKLREINDLRNGECKQGDKYSFELADLALGAFVVRHTPWVNDFAAHEAFARELQRLNL